MSDNDFCIESWSCGEPFTNRSWQESNFLIMIIIQSLKSSFKNHLWKPCLMLRRIKKQNNKSKSKTARPGQSHAAKSQVENRWESKAAASCLSAPAARWHSTLHRETLEKNLEFLQFGLLEKILIASKITHGVWRNLCVFRTSFSRSLLQGFLP